jgi:hypothetical protein
VIAEQVLNLGEERTVRAPEVRHVGIPQIVDLIGLPEMVIPPYV